MLLVYGHYEYFNSFSAGIVFIRQNKTYRDGKFGRIRTALKGLKDMGYIILFGNVSTEDYDDVLTIRNVRCDRGISCGGSKGYKCIITCGTEPESLSVKSLTKRHIFHLNMFENLINHNAAYNFLTFTVPTQGI